MTLAIVDYGIGNLGSIANMLKRIGISPAIASSPEGIRDAKSLILPGVGSFDAAMSQLNNSGLRAMLDDAALIRKIPIMGICLGMQLMTLSSEEGKLPGLGWINANTRKFKSNSNNQMKIPHMGWNTLCKFENSSNINWINESSRYYFTHSYYVECNNPDDIGAQTRYEGFHFTSIICNKNFIGVQFHPEKSHRFGIELFKAVYGN